MIRRNLLCIAVTAILAFIGIATIRPALTQASTKVDPLALPTPIKRHVSSKPASTSAPRAANANSTAAVRVNANRTMKSTNTTTIHGPSTVNNNVSAACIAAADPEVCMSSGIKAAGTKEPKHYIGGADDGQSIRQKNPHHRHH